MDNKQKLLDALKGVPMLQKDKEEFVNIICSNNKSNSEDYYYGFYKVNESDLRFLTDMENFAITNIFTKIGFNTAGCYYLKPYNNMYINSGFVEGDEHIIAIPKLLFLYNDAEKYSVCMDTDFILKNRTDEFENLYHMIDNGVEITKEEFFDGLDIINE